MPIFTLIFILAIIATIGTQLWLSIRQTKHVTDNRPAVPAEFKESITLEEHQKAADYTAAKGSFGRKELAISTLLLLVWTLGGGLQWINNLWADSGLGELTRGTAVIMTFLLISSLIDLPASLYRTFVIEEKFGFNKSTIKTIIVDMVKGSLLSLAIGVPLIMLVLWLMNTAGSLWWFYAWLAITAFSILMMWAYPKFIAPIFNKFTPLEEGEVLDRITTLLNRNGFNSNGVFMMDGS
ncbi:UNVERIFIED_CONTAM: hypothetical protein GTU68_053060, partial [Idotea baltica]|nr:hypothetical protein [Idotea baltica]